MKTPAPVAYSEIPEGGVFSLDAKTFYEKSSDTLAFQLDNGQQLAITDPTTPYLYFPSAALVI
jgi:hypothetical protein